MFSRFVKNRCILFSETNIFEIVNKTATAARLVPGSSSVEYIQLYMCTMTVGVVAKAHVGE